VILRSYATQLRQLAAATEFDDVSRRLVGKARAVEAGTADLGEDAAVYLPACDCLTIEEHLSVCRVSA